MAISLVSLATIAFVAIAFVPTILSIRWSIKVGKLTGSAKTGWNYFSLGFFVIFLTLFLAVMRNAFGQALAPEVITAFQFILAAALFLLTPLLFALGVRSVYLQAVAFRKKLGLSTE